MISPVLVLNDAPLGSAGLTDHVTGPLAHAPSVALGVTVSVDCSSTVCGSVIAATVTVQMQLKEKSAIVLISLAVPNNFGAIYPKEIAEKFPPEVKVTEYVGTGPFKLAEWKPDQYIRMVRFDEYKSRAEKPNGYGGGKAAWVDEIRWIPVPEVATRVAQVETGELEFADDLNLDAYDRLQTNPNVRTIVSKPYYWLVAVFNTKDDLMTNAKIHQA